MAKLRKKAVIRFMIAPPFKVRADTRLLFRRSAMKKVPYF